MWSPDRGLRIDPIEYRRYEERLEAGRIEDSTVNFHHLCSNTGDTVGRVNSAFQDVLLEAIVFDPYITTIKTDLVTLARF